jgi:hypothetical protein
MPDDTELIDAVRSRLDEQGFTHGWYIRSAEASSSAYEQEDNRDAMAAFIARRAKEAEKQKQEAK